MILAEGPEAAAQGVAICYDCRVHSQEFAQAAAGVMAANGIPVRLFQAMRPIRISILLCRAGVRLHRRAQRHRQPQPAGVQRLQGVLV